MGEKMKLALFSIMAALPCLAQFRLIEIKFEGVGCAGCIDSLPSRMQRLRGVESAVVDVDRGILKVHLATQNRVRLEQVRDLIEQDGTKTVQAAVRVKGDLAKLDAKWLLRPKELSTSYEVESKAAAPLSPGAYLVVGVVTRLRSGSGPIVIEATEFQKSE